MVGEMLVRPHVRPSTDHAPIRGHLGLIWCFLDPFWPILSLYRPIFGQLELNQGIFQSISGIFALFLTYLGLFQANQSLFRAYFGLPWVYFSLFQPFRPMLAYFKGTRRAQKWSRYRIFSFGWKSFPGIPLTWGTYFRTIWVHWTHLKCAFYKEGYSGLKSCESLHFIFSIQ